MSGKKSPLTIVLLTDAGCARVNHAKPGLLFLVERFTAAAKEGERVAHVRDYRFRDQMKHYAIWSLGPDQYQIVCEADEDAAILYGPAIGKPLPDTNEPQSLPTSGRQGTTATPANRFAICAGWDFERIGTKRKLLKSLELSLDFATSGWSDIPEDVRQRLLGVPAPSNICTSFTGTATVMHDNIIAHSATRITRIAFKTSQTYCSRCGDWFEPAKPADQPSFPYLITVTADNERTEYRAILTRDHHTEIEICLHELQDTDNIDTFTIDDEEGGSYLTFTELANAIKSTYAQQQPKQQTISDRTAQHYTDPARD